MDNIDRTIFKDLKSSLFKGKVILITGARQVGKTTLLRKLVQDSAVKSLWLNADEADIKMALENANTSTELKTAFGNADLIIIDEAQQIKEIGKKLKLIVDSFPELQIIATGSSSFDLLQQSNEPLTGRKIEFKLFPLSFSEMAEHDSVLIEKRNLESRLLYGSYPEVINNPGREQQVLNEVVNSYLYQDILRYDGINKSSVIEKLVLALALQVGSEVSYNELSRSIGNISAATIEKYIDILEKAFVVFKLNALSRNVRNEIKKGKKIYFHDNGVRNSVINNFNTLSLRSDKGAMFENYLVAERVKRNHYNSHFASIYFWRTFDQAEVDYIEEYGGALHAYEFKWTAGKNKIPATLANSYEIASTNFINSNNYNEFLT